MTQIWIPEEIWLLIIDYMDTTTFYNTIFALREAYPNLVNNLFRTICLRVLKIHPRIRLMNYLYSSLNSSYFKKCENYLMFKNIFTNSIFNKNKKFLSFKECTYNTQIAKDYRNHIIGILREKESKKNERLFSNLTKINTSDLFFTKEELRDKIVFKYRNITINLEDVFNYTYNLNRKEYQGLVQLRCQLDCRQAA